MKKVLVTCLPFGEIDRRPLQELEAAGIQYDLNPLDRDFTEDDLIERISAYDAVIAGTERISARVIQQAAKVKHISRIGIGLDSVDLNAARQNNIGVSYTPDAPSPAVAELTIGLMLNFCRGIHLSNQQMHQGLWHRQFGTRIGELTIGIIGVGRIGKRVTQLLNAFRPQKILANDIAPDELYGYQQNLKWADKEQVLREADIVSIHVPLTPETKNMIGKDQLDLMKPSSCLINTARGGIVVEQDLVDSLRGQRIAGAAIDVFNQEPYQKGPLSELENCILTAHMGSMSFDCRARMELEATQETIRFLQGMPLRGVVPEAEYQNQSRF